MATYRKRGKSWQAQVRRGGIVKAKSFRTKAMSEAWARQTEDSKIKMLKSRLGTVPLGHLTANRIVQHVDARLKECKAETVRKELSTISHVLKVAQSLWGVRVRGDPVKSAKTILSVTNALSPGDRRDRRLSPAEEFALKRALPICAKAAFMLALETGMRRGEIVTIRRSHIRDATLYIPDTKTGEARTIPLTKKAQKILARLEGDPLFTVMPDSITQAFERACARAGIDGLTFHDLRHEATSRLFERGLTIPEVALITGHKTWESLKRYTNLKPADLVGKI